MNKANLAIFIPHIGCPHRCAFCDQTAISGHGQAPTPEEVSAFLQQAVKKLKPEFSAEIAFFGGSFTAIDRGLMVAYLQAAQPFLTQENIMGIRCSTRPDCIDKEVLDLLKSYGVTAIELGAQSMDNAVLAKNHRGHTAQDTVQAAGLIKAAGLQLGLQMMTGMMGSDPQTDRQTARELIALQPHGVRIYPTVVLENTPLAQAYQKGDYVPLSLERTVALCGDLLEEFHNHRIRVYKLGLHPGMEEQMLDGPYHPCFGELCQSRVYFNKTLSLWQGESQLNLQVGVGCTSKFVGHKKQNILALKEKGIAVTLTENPDLSIYDIKKV